MSASAERLVLTGARVFDGTGTAPAAGRAVVVEGERIAGVVDAREAPPGRVIDLAGCTLLPGLVDCHVHLVLGAEADPVRALQAETPAATTIKALLRARRQLEAGVTTVRDLGGRDWVELAVRDAIRAGLVPGPRVLAAGKPVCMTGGHGWWIGREADGPVDMRRAVREQLKAGADVIKLIATGGVMTPGVDPNAPQLESDELAAAVEEARKAGRRAAAHAQATEGIARCLAAGITTIEHGVFLTEELAARMARDGVALVPTLVAPHQIGRGGLAGGIPEFMVRKSLAIGERHLASFRMALAAGVAIAAGTDAGTPLNPHGDMATELELMAAGGMTPSAALAAATTAAAEALGLAGETGRIAAGLAADLLAVAGDPTARLDAVRAVRLVVARGAVVVDRRDAGAPGDGRPGLGAQRA